MKSRLIEDCRDAWPVQAVCRVLGVSTARYCAWRGRPESRCTVKDRALLGDIGPAHANSGGRYGSPRGQVAYGQAGERWAAAGSSA